MKHMRFDWIALGIKGWQRDKTGKYVDVFFVIVFLGLFFSIIHVMATN